MPEDNYYFDYLIKTERFPQSLYHQAKHEMVSEMLQSLAPNSYILDAACGIGNITSKYCNSHFVFGIDEQFSAVRYCRLHHSGKYIQSSVYKTPFLDNIFDAVLFLDAIEHLHNPTKALEELSRVIKPGGLILVCTMNYESPLWTILEHTWHRFFGGKCKPYSKEVHPVQYNTKILRSHCNLFFKEICFRKRIMNMELFYIGKK